MRTRTPLRLAASGLAAQTAVAEWIPFNGTLDAYCAAGIQNNKTMGKGGGQAAVAGYPRLSAQRNYDAIMLIHMETQSSSFELNEFYFFKILLDR